MQGRSFERNPEKRPKRKVYKVACQAGRASNQGCGGGQGRGRGVALNYSIAAKSGAFCFWFCTLVFPRSISCVPLAVFLCFPHVVLAFFMCVLLQEAARKVQQEEEEEALPRAGGKKKGKVYLFLISPLPARSDCPRLHLVPTNVALLVLLFCNLHASFSMPNESYGHRLTQYLGSSPRKRHAKR